MGYQRVQKINKSNGTANNLEVENLSIKNISEDLTAGKVAVIEDNGGVGYISKEDLLPKEPSIINQIQAQSFAESLKDLYIADGAKYFPNSSAYDFAKQYEGRTKPTLAFYPSAVKAGVWYNASDDRSLDGTVIRASTATYMNQYGKIATAAINELRVDYSDGGCPRLLLENSSTNYITYSQDIDNADWEKLGLGAGSLPIATPNVGVAPDGTLTADRVQFNLNGNVGFTDRSILRNTTTIPNGEKVISFWAKSFNGNEQEMLIFSNSTESGLITVTSEWQRFERIADDDADIGFGLELRGTFNSSDSADILLWGYQVELGDFASSYIPTSGAIATRGLDIVANAGNVNTFNDSEGTIFFEGAKTKEVRDCRISLNDGSISNRLTLIFNEEGDTVTTLVVSNDVNEPSLVYSIPSFDNTENNKYALTYGVNGQKLFINGVLVDSDNNALTFIGLSDLDLKAAAASSLNFFGTVKDYRYYNRALSDEELINLTS